MRAGLRRDSGIRFLIIMGMEFFTIDIDGDVD